MSDQLYSDERAWGEASNDVIFDWMDVILFWYFSLIFATTGSHLEYATAFILNLRIFGIHDVWTKFREEPAYISPPTANSLIRCLGASILATTVQKEQPGGTELVEGFTIVALSASNVMVTLDPYMREAAGCAEELGDPTVDFPYGAWEDCEDWKLAYYATWWYAFAPFICLATIGALLYFGTRCCGILDTVCRYRNHIVIAQVSANCAALGTRVSVRRFNTDDHTEEINYFLEYCFYIYGGLFFLALELFHKFCMDKGGCFKMVCRGCCSCLAIPLIVLDTALKKLVGNKEL